MTSSKPSSGDELSTADVGQRITLLAFVWVMLLIGKLYSPFGLAHIQPAIGRWDAPSAGFGFLCVAAFCRGVPNPWRVIVPGYISFGAITISDLREGAVGKVSVSALILVASLILFKRLAREK